MSGASTNPADGYEHALALQRALEQNLVAGCYRLPPVRNVIYAACAVYRSGAADRGFLALGVGHLDDDGAFILDILKSDVSEAVADTVVKRYRVLPANYLIEPLEAAGIALAQAAAWPMLHLQKPPPSPPHYCSSWQHMLLFQRICELREAEYKASCAIWEGDVMVRELPFDGACVERLINDAIEHFERDDLDRAERLCALAERTMVRRRP